MRKILSILALTLALPFFMVSICFAGVTGSRHDMFFMQKGTDTNICSYCHIPHNAAGDKIWSIWGNEAQLTSGPSTTIGNMCYTCHDGTATYRGQNTVFNASLQQHKVSAGSDCDMCHTVHDNVNGMFMEVPRQLLEGEGGGAPTYCAGCHDAIVNAGGLGDHRSAGNNHGTCAKCHPDGYYADGESTIKMDGALDCYLCHSTAHSGVNYSAGGIRYPLLKQDNTNSQFCAACHPDTTGDISYSHYTNKTGSYGNITCQTCHDPHQPGVAGHPSLLKDYNIDSQMCIDCHNGTRGPNIGHSHPYQVPFGSVVPADSDSATGTPAGNAIWDGRAFYGGMGSLPGPDYPLNSANVICETCHSTHSFGKDSHLLRRNNTAGGLCLNCHGSK